MEGAFKNRFYGRWHLWRFPKIDPEIEMLLGAINNVPFEVDEQEILSLFEFTQQTDLGVPSFVRFLVSGASRMGDGARGFRDVKTLEKKCDWTLLEIRGACWCVGVLSWGGLGKVSREVRFPGTVFLGGVGDVLLEGFKGSREFRQAGGDIEGLSEERGLFVAFLKKGGDGAGAGGADGFQGAGIVRHDDAANLRDETGRKDCDRSDAHGHQGESQELEHPVLARWIWGRLIHSPNRS